MTEDKLMAWLEEIKADAQGRAPKGSLERDVRIMKLTRIIRHLWEANEASYNGQYIASQAYRKVAQARKEVLEMIEESEQ